LLKKIREENGKEREENQHHRDDMRQDIAGIKTQLHIIQQKLSTIEGPVHNVKTFIPSPKGNQYGVIILKMCDLSINIWFHCNKGNLICYQVPQYIT